MKQVGQRPDLGHGLLGQRNGLGEGAAFAITEPLSRSVQPREEHLQAGKILGCRFVKHLSDSPALVVLRAHQSPCQRPHLIVRVVQLAFRRLTGGNVFVDDNRSRDAVVRVADRDRRVLDDLPNSVERFDVDDFIDRGCAVDEGTHRCPFFRRESFSGGVPPRLTLGVPLASGAYRPAPDALRSRITENDVPREINDRDADGERIQYQPQEALASPQPIFGALPISNILKAIDRSYQFSVATSQGNNIHQRRYARSVGPLYHYFQVVNFDSGPEHL